MSRPEDRLLKNLMPQAVQDQQQLAPEPPVIMFKAFRLDLLDGMDPVTGQVLTTMLITAGNGSMQVAVPLDPISRAVLARELAKKAGMPNGDPSGMPPEVEDAIREAQAAGALDLSDAAPAGPDPATSGAAAEPPPAEPAP